MSASSVGAESFLPYFEGIKSSGAINTDVPPSNCPLHDTECLGSRAIVTKPKSARQARGGTSLEIRMFACHMSEEGIRCKGKKD